MLKDRQFWMVAGGLALAFIVFWLAGHPGFRDERVVMFLAITIMAGTLIYFIRLAHRGGDFYLRSIPGLKAVEEAVGRSTQPSKVARLYRGVHWVG